jgi:hypothetical protein
MTTTGVRHIGDGYYQAYVIENGETVIECDHMHYDDAGDQESVSRAAAERCASRLIEQEMERRGRTAAAAERALSAMAGLPEGSRWPAGSPETFIARRDGALVVVTSWPVNEGHDDDYGSVSCGCALAGEAHRHYEYRADGEAQAVSAYVAASERRRSRQAGHGLPDGAVAIVE